MSPVAVTPKCPLCSAGVRVDMKNRSCICSGCDTILYPRFNSITEEWDWATEKEDKWHLIYF